LFAKKQKITKKTSNNEKNKDLNEKEEENYEEKEEEEEVELENNVVPTNNTNSQLVQFDKEMIWTSLQKESKDAKYVDVTPYIFMPQRQAAKELGLPSSTLCKRWKEATMQRKWPRRNLRKIDKEISKIIQKIPPSCGTSLDVPTEAYLGLLLKKKAEEMKPVSIRISP